ncbi:hypothetical protein HELRODRAFT_181648 [Helobdella robusta]|uniref:GPI inositol-deacylase n=1 Tax=Helobdella robusta TaxID=6412 RepID=T1FH72_HELRO|nr:hypothetical protein HELRODRAFT_181648 [Helobdella robusta]ESN92178.1 hypothetical protein HELRODRAFT_181648 [Helobdella robusta]
MARRELTVIKGTFLLTLLLIFFVACYVHLFGQEASECDGNDVIINAKLSFHKIKLASSITDKFPNYKLFYYGKEENDLRKLNGQPILFIPGHSGSHLDVAGLGSSLHRIIKKLKITTFHFDVFALDFNQELSGFYGGVIKPQTEFSQECIDQVLLLYSSRNNNIKPESVVIIGHHMGGIVARSLFLLASFDRSSVQTIVTLATPHIFPPVAVFDSVMASVYTNVNEYWAKKMLDAVVFISIGGGVNNLIDRQQFAKVDKVVTELARALYDTVDKKSNRISADASHVHSSFQYHFEKNSGPVYQKMNYDLMTNIEVSIPWKVKKKKTFKFVERNVSAASYVVMTMAKVNAPNYGFLALTNIDDPSWVGACTLNGKEVKCKQMGNFARYANLIPPTNLNIKMVMLNSDRLDMFTHWIIRVPHSSQPMLMMMEMYKLSNRTTTHRVTSLHDVILSPIQSLTEDKIIINTTRSSHLFYNISLSGFVSIFQAYTIKFKCVRCGGRSEGE